MTAQLTGHASALQSEISKLFGNHNSLPQARWGLKRFTAYAGETVVLICGAGGDGGVIGTN